MTPKDIEVIERIVYKNSDDIAVAISRSFERLEERIDAVESRIYSRLAEIEDVTVNEAKALTEEITELRSIVEGDSEAVIGTIK